jgi:hypothetical protein
MFLIAYSLTLSRILHVGERGKLTTSWIVELDT